MEKNTNLEAGAEYKCISVARYSSVGLMMNVKILLIS